MLNDDDEDREAQLLQGIRATGGMSSFTAGVFTHMGLDFCASPFTTVCLVTGVTGSFYSTLYYIFYLLMIPSLHQAEIHLNLLK